ncbi:LysR substrate-binding domain-containing protein [Tardiphaga sp. 20_F10_N6_6]|jgi:LysR family cyn operon transcriptional activator|uniref:LysR substrate-binding domain-containing protein n=1 Tax=Tardiphaga TaxID=1395974 RepID=UPI0015864280|nr:LysR substrate-binding domain-containing protein [Tardiphaga robiniae]NUU42918.1 LysR family transcriptional regulator [Tardiphaga robiniae]
MDPRRLGYFLAIATHKRMAKAAEALGVAQPTLSQQIRALEQDLGTVLFNRTPQGMQLTETGHALREHAQRLMVQTEAARTAIAELEGGMAGTLRVGVIYTYSTTFLPKIIGSFGEKYPEVRLSVEVGSANDVERHILSGDLDLAIAFAPPQHAELGVDLLFEERLVLVLAKSQNQSRQQSITLQALAQRPLALLTPAFATRRILDQSLPPDIQLDVRVEMNSVEALIELAKSGGLPTVLADRSLNARKDLAIIPIGPPWIRRSGALLWDAHRYQTAAARAFMAIARKTTKSAQTIRAS